MALILTRQPAAFISPPTWGESETRREEGGVFFFLPKFSNQKK